MSMDTGHPTHPLFKSMKRGWEDSSGEVRVLTTPQLMGILATRIGGKLRIVCLYERSVRPAYAMYTLSTGYQRPPQPRIIARSWPLRRLTATTTPMAQDTLAREVECLISNGCLNLTKVC